MSIKRVAAILVLCLLGFTLFTIPVGVIASSRYPACVMAEGNITLSEDDLGPFNITLQSNFTAMVPTELAQGNYTALFSGEAHVSNETIEFEGSLTADGSEFHVSFTVPNIFPEIPIGEEEKGHHGCHDEYEAEGELQITITQISAPLEWREDRYPAMVIAEGNITLEDDPGAFNIPIQSNFTAMVPIELAQGNYTALFSGEADVSNETVKFRGTLTVNGSEFHVSFTVPNIFPEIPIGEEEEGHHGCHDEYDASGELKVAITQISVPLPTEKTRVKIKGYVDSYGGQPAFGWLKAEAKFGEWTKVRTKVQAFFVPGNWRWKGEHSFQNANVTMEGNVTLTWGLESFDITIVAPFLARVPEEIESGAYTALYGGLANVSSNSVRFSGYLSVDEYEFPVKFTIPNMYSQLPIGYCTASGELWVTITRLPATHFEFALYMVRLVNASMVKLNYSGNAFYISGLWDVYNITWAYSDEDNFNITVKPVVVNGTGEFSVTGGWREFNLNITGIELVSGKVVFLCYRSFVIPPGDVNDDYIVDIFDLVHAAKRYGTTPGIADFDFDLDFNDDFEIDIYDLTTIGANLGEDY